MESIHHIEAAARSFLIKMCLDRVLESVFENLIRWADAALEKTSNQPSLPHAVIVFNATDPDDKREDPGNVFWTMDQTAKEVFAEFSRSIHQNETFNKYVEFWRGRGVTVDSFESLIQRYYSSVSVRLQMLTCSIWFPSVLNSTGHSHSLKTAAQVDTRTSRNPLFHHQQKMRRFAEDKADTSYALRC